MQCPCGVRRPSGVPYSAQGIQNVPCITVCVQLKIRRSIVTIRHKSELDLVFVDNKLFHDVFDKAEHALKVGVAKAT